MPGEWRPLGRWGGYAGLQAGTLGCDLTAPSLHRPKQEVLSPAFVVPRKLSQVSQLGRFGLS